MNLNRLTKQAKRIVEQRGGVESLKQDANQLKDIAAQPGSLRDKAKAAAAALKNPGANAGAEAAPAPAEAAPAPAAATEAKPAPDTGIGS